MHRSLEGVADAFKAVAKLTVRAREEDEVVGVSNRDISQQSASTSSLLRPLILVAEG